VLISSISRSRIQKSTFTHPSTHKKPSSINAAVQVSPHSHHHCCWSGGSWCSDYWLEKDLPISRVFTSSDTPPMAPTAVHLLLWHSKELTLWSLSCVRTTMTALLATLPIVPMSVGRTYKEQAGDTEQGITHSVLWTRHHAPNQK
jgi:hypothetical protein